MMRGLKLRFGHGQENALSRAAQKRYPRPGIVSWSMPILVLASLLAGCSDNGMNDLRQFVEGAKLKKGHVEPLPEFKPVESYAYAAGNLKDPFSTWKSELKTAGQDGVLQGLRPDINRAKEILENYPLDTLHMMGTFDYQKTKWGLVKAPDGIIYKVREGQHLGQNFGEVKKVNETAIVMSEIVPDGLGGWEEREASLAISEE